MRDAGSTWPLGLSGPIPSDRWVAYGLVVDRDRDGIADVRIGMDNAPDGEHRAWRTDLVTGETIAQTGPPYGMGGLPDTYFPGEGEGKSSRGGVPRCLRRTRSRASGTVSRTHFYAWASQIEDGRIVATDYAPDIGLDRHPAGRLIAQASEYVQREWAWAPVGALRSPR